MTTKEQAEQRQIPRTPYEEDILVTGPRHMEGRTVDVGAGGVGLLLPGGFDPGVRLTLQIFHGRLIVQGTVRWCRPEGEQFKLGLQFDELDWSILERVGMLMGEFPTTA